MTITSIPNFYRIGEEKVTFWVGDEAEKALKAHLTKEMEAFLKLLQKMGGTVYYAL